MAVLWIALSEDVALLFEKQHESGNVGTIKQAINPGEKDVMINCRNINKADAVLLSAPYGKSFSHRFGAHKGPGKVIKCFTKHLEAFDRFTLNEPEQLFKIAHHKLTDLNTLSSEHMTNRVREFFTSHSDKFIFMLGGSHSVSIGAFHSISEMFDPRDVTILQIDAHPDLRDSPADYKRSSDPFDHACVMRRAYEMHFNTVQIGIRTISIFDYEFIKQHNLTVFEWGKGETPSINQIIDSIKTDNVYLTIDTDGLDPSYAPGTGTPVPGGLEWNYTLSLIRRLIYSKRIVGADIVEIVPIKDNVITEFAVAHLCYNIVSYRLLKDKGILEFHE